VIESGAGWSKRLVWPRKVHYPILVALASAPVGGSELPDGATLYIRHQCHICHGEHGREPARSGYPVIAGQDRRYLVRQILDIRDGVRENGQASLMRAMVKPITEQEVETIADYLSTQ
jgi:cytochrome c